MATQVTWCELLPWEVLKHSEWVVVRGVEISSRAGEWDTVWRWGLCSEVRRALITKGPPESGEYTQSIAWGHQLNFADGNLRRPCISSNIHPPPLNLPPPPLSAGSSNWHKSFCSLKAHNINIIVRRLNILWGTEALWGILQNSLIVS